MFSTINIKLISGWLSVLSENKDMTPQKVEETLTRINNDPEALYDFLEDWADNENVLFQMLLESLIYQIPKQKP